MAEINMQKIADLAGVSRATVSRVLSTPEKVKPQTREHILKIIEESDYVYHAGAADLLKKKTHIIGIVMPTVISSVFANTILAVQRAATELGMSLLLGCSEFSPEKERAIFHQFLARRVAGIIMIGYCRQNEEFILNLYRNGVPSVVIWDSPNDSPLSQVGFDNLAAAAQATRYLTDLGHRHIAMIRGPRDGGSRAEDRVVGFMRTMEDNGLTVCPAEIVSCEPSIDNGERLAMDLLSRRPCPTAIFAASDLLAIGAMSAARKLGLRVPEDVSVMGFDNIDFASHTNPPLTTVAVPEKQMSVTAAHMIKQLINGEIASPKACSLETSLVVRGSCARPRGGRPRSHRGSLLK